MSASRTAIHDEERLDNVHPGDVLREDFLIGSAIPVEEVSVATGIPVAELKRLLDCSAAITAEVDLRLGRYFGVSEGFFLGLQDDYDLEEVRRSEAGAEIDRIVPRAA
ncbi:MAG TPA: HigA family addiction module antitoxin [Sphingomicrobium sp.]|nr:HigA family addiction module antitoxin [Sphingomicrobium sp.]